jgi:hypothetical protein
MPPNQIRVKTRSLPAPTGGWNKRDQLSEMEPDEAWVLDNFIPGPLGVQQRRGTAAYTTGMTGNFVESLMEYNAAGSSPKLFAALPNNIYDASSRGAAGAAEVTGLTNGRWQHTMFATAGGTFLVAVNGADAVKNYNGTVWSDPAITGVTGTTLINVCGHISRLWFVRSGTLKTYYLPALSIAGAATEIDFAPLCKKGGELVAMASWSRDGGAGLDDHAVFATSKGQILVYYGTDPSSINTWTLVGIFDAPEPIGKRCFVKLGADLCYLSSQGVLSLPEFLPQNSAGRSKSAVTDKIVQAFQDAYRTAGTSFGWQILEYPKENLLIVNVPITERATQYQYVMNLRTGKWCRFTGINANCMALKGDALFFGGNDGKTRAYGETGVYDDDDEPISALACQAYNDFNIVQEKTFKKARALVMGPTGYVPQIKLMMDYKHDSLPTFSPPNFEEIGPAWDEVFWDVEDWGAALAVSNQWRPVSGKGAVASICLASSLTTQLTWNQTDIQFEIGRAN